MRNHSIKLYELNVLQFGWRQRGIMGREIHALVGLASWRSWADGRRGCAWGRHELGLSRTVFCRYV